MIVKFNNKRIIGIRNQLIYGHFVEHFHRQIYDGIYDPESELADADGFRVDVLQAMREINVPILRWPGGCFVSSYHWKDGVGCERIPAFDKAWRVEDPNTFGTDEFILLCKKIGCEQYICSNAGTGTPEEMSDWVEYCNLQSEGRYANCRIKNGHNQAYDVKYWSIGNENYGAWEMGAKTKEEWWRYVRESAKMVKRVDPRIELSAAALTDVEWNIELLKHCHMYLDWISVHEYWNGVATPEDYADYGQVMLLTNKIDHSINEVRGLLTAMKLENQIKIAFDEWNLRGWYHPNSHTVSQPTDKNDYIAPRDENDNNARYTMADAIFTACFLNALNRNCDIVEMANFAPVVNARGCIFTYDKGIVLRSTYFVFYLYTKYMGDIVFDFWNGESPEMEVVSKEGDLETVKCLDIIITGFSKSNQYSYAIAAVNKDAKKSYKISLNFTCGRKPVVHYTLNGEQVDSYNDIDKEGIRISEVQLGEYYKGIEVELAPHSVNVISI